MISAQRPRVEFLDGIRGLAALYVMLGHAYIYIRSQVDPVLSPLELKLFKLLDLGHYAVAIFIVLSGYLLMLPVARSSDGRLSGGWRSYLVRRGQRIMPPYYAALALSIILIGLFAQIGEPGDLSLPSVATHVLMVHNLFPDYKLSINGPLWSVAMEWQIYFLLPLVLLPAWRRGGLAALAVVGLALGLAPLLLPPQYNFEWTHPWYIGLFTLGAVGSLISFSSGPPAVWLRTRLPWRVLALGQVALMAYLLFFRLRWSWEHLWISDTLMGLATMSTIVYLQRLSTRRADPLAGSGRGLLDLPGILALRSLEARPVVVLGAFSYSLYLVHEVLLLLASSYLLPLALPLWALLAVQFLLTVPATLLLCYLFSFMFEQPFVQRHAPTRAAADTRAAPEPIAEAPRDEPEYEVEPPARARQHGA